MATQPPSARTLEAVRLAQLVARMTLTADIERIARAAVADGEVSDRATLRVTPSGTLWEFPNE